MSETRQEIRDLVAEVLAELAGRGASPGDARPTAEAGSTADAAPRKRPGREIRPKASPDDGAGSRAPGGSAKTPENPASSPEGSAPRPVAEAARSPEKPRPGSSSPASLLPPASARSATAGAAAGAGGACPHIEVADPTGPEPRRATGVTSPVNPVALNHLIASTSARIGVGRAGPRPRTRSLLLFQADHAVTQDAIFGDVPGKVLEEFGMFEVQSRVTSADEYLVHPDLGRLLSDEGRALVEKNCVKKPNVQIVAGDGLSAAAIANNLDKIYPVLTSGFAAAGLTMGTPFFVKYCRVGIINDINSIIGADAVVLLIGERPGLGVADAMSVYSGYRPTPGKTDAHRDVVCMITVNGGTNPMEAGAFVVDHIRTVIDQKASGVDLRRKQSGER